MHSSRPCAAGIGHASIAVVCRLRAQVQHAEVVRALGQLSEVHDECVVLRGGAGRRSHGCEGCEKSGEEGGYAGPLRGVGRAEFELHLDGKAGVALGIGSPGVTRRGVGVADDEQVLVSEAAGDALPVDGEAQLLAVLQVACERRLSAVSVVVNDEGGKGGFS